MSRRASTSTPTFGAVRHVALALLLTTMLLVPLSPMVDAGAPSGLARASVSNNTPRATGVDYNFTFTAGGTDDTLHVIFPSGFDISAASLGGNNFTTPTDNGDSGQTLNFTSVGIVAGNQYYMNILDVGLPADTGTFALTVRHIDDTWADNGTQSANILSIPTVSLDIDVDTTKTNPGAGATTDYVFDVDDHASFAQGDNLTIKFPVGFDLSDATIGTNEASGRSISYTFTGSENSAFEITVEDVVNPSVNVDTEYPDVTAEVVTTADDTIASGTFDIDIVATDIDVDRSGTSTTIQEGEEDDDTVLVQLTSEPADSVTVAIDGGDQITVDDDELTFTTSNWDVPQTVTLTAVDDNDVEGTLLHKLTFTSSSDDETYDELEATFNVQVLDNDVGIVLRHLDAEGDEDTDTVVTEGDKTGDTYEVFLATQPEHTVTINIDPHADLDVDDDELKFTENSWDDPQVVIVTSARSDDDDFLEDVERTIVHTASSSDEDYDGETAELTVTITDDEHKALGLTESQVDEANKLVEVTLTEEDDGILIEWTLPDQEDLDDIFDSDGEITIQGVQIFYANSPYTLAQTFDDTDDEFEDGSWTHDFDDGASLRTKYLVTMFYQEDVGLFDADDLPDTRDEGYEGTALQEPLLPWWGWLLIAIAGVVLVGFILAAVMSAQNKRAFGIDDWDDEEDTSAPKEAAATSAASVDDEDEAPAKKKRARKYDLECPVCDHHFAVKGVKPLNTECPNCGAKGVLN